jgi:membrane protease YdiL (CAAX protease family)
MCIQFAILAVIILLRSLGALGDTPEEISKSLFSPALIAIQVTTTCTLLSVLALVIPKIYRLKSLSWLKINTPRPSLVFFAFLGIAGTGFIVDEALFLLHSLFPTAFNTNGLTAFNTVFAQASTGAFFVLTLAVTIGPGIGEELFFRGLMLRAFQTNMKPILAVVCSSILFGVMHVDLLQSVGATFIGLFLGFVAIKAGSIVPSVVAHAINNLLCALFARYNEQDTIENWTQGHPPEVLIPAAFVTATSIAMIVKLTKKKKLT